MAQKISSVLLAFSSVFFGLAFAWALLFSSNHLFPFYSDFFNRGHFFYLLILLVWTIFLIQRIFRFIYLPKPLSFFNKGRGVLFVFLINFILFLQLSKNGELSYLYVSPILFSIQIFLFYILLGSRVLFLRHNKIFIFLGVLLAWYLFPFYSNLLPAFLFAFLVFLFLLICLWLQREKPCEEILYFQNPIVLYAISFLHYFFLIMLFGSVWQQMDYFYHVIVILLFGFALKKIIIVKKIQLAKRYFGLYLGYLFLISLLFVHFLPFSLWTAFLYTVLSLWLALFFPKVLDKDETDVWLVGEVIVLALLLQSFSFEWIEIFLLLVVIVFQIFFIFFFLKRFRYTTVFIFLVALFAWSFTIHNELSSAKEISLLKNQKHYSYSPLVLSWLWQFTNNKTIVTNAFATEVVAAVKNYSMEYRSFRSLFLPFYLRYLASDSQVFFIDLQRLGVYQKKEQIEVLLKSVSKNKKLHALFFLYTHEDILLYKVANSRMSLLPAMPVYEQPTLEQKNILYETAMLLGYYFEQNSLFNDALLIYRQLLPWFEQDVLLYYRLSRTSGSMGAIDLQMYYLEKYLSLNNSFSLAQEQQMMELLFLKGKYKESLQKAEKLIRYDSQNSLDYFKWVFRIAERTENRRDWHRIYQRVLNYTVKKNSTEERKKLALVDTIEKFLLQHPEAVEVIKRERIRQETLEIPED